MGLTFGVIADDFTGATDIANNLVRAGLRVVQYIGVPGAGARDAVVEAQRAGAALPAVDAVVVALKSRTAPVDEALAQSLEAARWLRGQGARQLCFKVCSTFDSTAEGNIGPVAEALAQAVDAGITLVTPAFPENGRTVFKGHLFVGDQLLSESPMRHHPLTPMTDANLVRVMQAQCRHARVGLVDHRSVARGAAAVRERLAALQAEGCTFAIADAVGNADLLTLGAAVHDAPLTVAGSGLAIGLAPAWGFVPNDQAAGLPSARGASAIVSGSCSAATHAQVEHFLAQGGAGYMIDPLRLAAGEDLASQALAWALPRLVAGPVLVYATAAPESVRKVQAELGVQRAGELVEQCLATVAAGLVAGGVGRLLVAGGETSGACVQRLGVSRLRIGRQIDPGVPWCHAPCEAAPQGVHLALKSGNFGATDFFTRAFELLQP